MSQALGFITFSEEIVERSVGKVRDAACAAGFGDFCKDLTDRSCFIRATKKLVAEGVIEAPEGGVLRDRIIDSETELAFQFSRKHLMSQGVNYENAAVVRFDKASGLITCNVPEVKDLAEKLVSQVRGVFSVTDINGLVKKVYESECKRVPIRDAIYFVPVQRQALVKQIEKFYAELGFCYITLPVGHADKQGPALLKATARELKDNIARISEEINGLKTDGKLTPRIAKNRFKELQVDLARYQEIAQSLQVDLKDILQGAGDTAQALVQVAQPLDALIQMVQQGGKLSPVVFDLLQADEDNAKAVEALQTVSAMQDIDLPDMTVNTPSANAVEALEAVQVDLVGKKGR